MRYIIIAFVALMLAACTPAPVRTSSGFLPQTRPKVQPMDCITDPATCDNQGGPGGH